MTSQAKARIWWDSTIQAYRLSSPFNRQLVDAIKSHIPASDRSLDDATKIWTFTERHFKPFTNMLTLIGIHFVSVTRQQTEAASGGPSSSTAPAAKQTTLDSVLITFVKTLPYDAALAAYRKAAMLLHPDRGGDMQKMSELNVAWTRIEKELYPNR